MGGEWKESKLIDVADKIAMGPFGSNIKVETFKNSGIPIISGMHLHGIRLLDKDFNYISETHAEKLLNSNVFRHDVIFTHAGTIGQVSYIPDTSKYERYVISQRQFYLRCKPEKLDYQYIAYFFKSPYGRHLIDSNTNQTGVPSIAQPATFLKNTCILLPPLPEQKAISNVLSSLDDKIDLLHRQNKTLETMAETLFRQWFIEEAQENWKEGCLGDIVDINPTYQLKKGANSCYLEMSNLSTSTFNPSGWIQREFTSGMKFKNGDTLLARITPCLENGKTCYVTFLKEDEVGWGSTEYIVLRMKKPYHPYISYIFAKNQDFREYAISSMSGSSGRQRAQSEMLKEYIFKIPPQSIIYKLNTQLSAITEKLEKNALQIPTLEKLRDNLLPKLMSGEVRVNYE